MQPALEALPIRYMTFNLCNIPQMDKDPAYEGLRFNQRLEKIVQVITKIAPDVIGFQEVRDYLGGSVMADLWGRLAPLGYRLQSQEGSPHQFAVYNVIAYKAAKLWPQKVTSWWNSDTPDVCSCSYGNGWPRAVLAIEFCPVKEIAVAKGKGFMRPGPDLDPSLPALVVVNSHLGLGLKHTGADLRERVLSNLTTTQKIQEFVGAKPAFIVSLGDFNSFPDVASYEEEMTVYKSAGFIDGVTVVPLKNQDGVSIHGTFMGYSPDPFKCSNQAFGSSIDHIQYKFSNLLDASRVQVTNCFVSTLTGDAALDARKIEKESDLLVDENQRPLRDQYPSDHLPAILDVEIRR